MPATTDIHMPLDLAKVEADYIDALRRNDRERMVMLLTAYPEFAKKYWPSGGMMADVATFEFIRTTIERYTAIDPVKTAKQLRVVSDQLDKERNKLEVAQAAVHSLTNQQSELSGQLRERTNYADMVRDARAKGELPWKASEPLRKAAGLP